MYNKDSARENGDVADKAKPNSNCSSVVTGAPRIAANSAATAVRSKSSDSIRQSSVRYSTTAGLPGETTAPD